MDEQLAAIYGTGQPEMNEEDLQKVAAAEFLVKLAEEQGIDLNKLSESDIAEMVNELYTEKTAEAQPEAQTETNDEPSPEFLEKAAEADYLGRIVAHSMWNELGNIQKAAGAPPFPFPPKKEGGEEKKEEKKEEKPKEEEKQAGVLEELAQRRAFEMAKEAGYIDAEGNLIQQPQQEQPDQKEKLAAAFKQAVETRALKICEEAGLPVEWNK
jgi:hypothetical protein